MSVFARAYAAMLHHLADPYHFAERYRARTPSTESDRARLRLRVLDVVPETVRRLSRTPNWSPKVEDYLESAIGSTLSFLIGGGILALTWNVRRDASTILGILPVIGFWLFWTAAIYGPLVSRLRTRVRYIYVWVTCFIVICLSLSHRDLALALPSAILSGWTMLVWIGAWVKGGPASD